MTTGPFVPNPTIDPKSLDKVGVLTGSRSTECEISLMSGNGVLAALRARGVDVHPFDPGLQSAADLAKQGFDHVVISLYGRFGEGGTIQGLLEQFGIPCTGSGVLTSALAMDKEATKRQRQTHDLPTPDFAILHAGADWQAVADRLDLPLIVKSAREGSSIGLTRVTSVAELPAAYEKAARLDRDVVAEQFIEGDELICPIIGEGESATVSSLIRIVTPQASYDYQNKYFADGTHYKYPAPITADVAARVQALVVQAYCGLSCHGWGRADIMLRKSNNALFLLEMNTSLGMTGHSLMPIGARAAGISYEDFVLRLATSMSLELHASTDWKPEQSTQRQRNRIT